MSKGKVISFEPKKKKCQVAVSILAAIFLVILYYAIFSFSEQDGEASGHLSHEVTKWIVESWERLIGGGWTEDVKTLGSRIGNIPCGSWRTSRNTW